MLSGLPIVLALAAQTAAVPPVEAPAAAPTTSPAYGPTQPPAPKPKVVPAAATADPCKPVETKDVKEDTREIVVCAPKIDGYRIDPDVLEAERVKKNHIKRRGPERLVDNSCQTVGPMGCRPVAGIDLVAAAMTAATMIQKAMSGENVGEMFVTDPQPDEYQLYKEAKAAREARAAEAAAAAKAAATSPAAVPTATK